MIYKVYLEALLCDKWQCNFIKNCDLGITEFGKNITISFTTEEEPTTDKLQNVIKILLSTRDNKDFEQYYSNVSVKRIEMLEVCEDD